MWLQWILVLGRWWALPWFIPPTDRAEEFWDTLAWRTELSARIGEKVRFIILISTKLTWTIETEEFQSRVPSWQNCRRCLPTMSELLYPSPAALQLPSLWPSNVISLRGSTTLNIGSSYGLMRLQKTLGSRNELQRRASISRLLQIRDISCNMSKFSYDNTACSYERFKLSDPC
jgi:hypothetical protein